MTWREHLKGRKVILSLSGGKDSSSASLWLQEQGVDHERVFLNTGWEATIVYEYLRGPLAEKLGPITELSGERQMEELILWKGMFPSRRRRFCTEELKVVPMQQHLNARVAAGEELVTVVGIRKAESADRAVMVPWEWSDGFDCEVWRPVLEWSLDDVIATHRRHGLKPNPLYMMGASRVGCWPCIYARKAEIRLIADTDPERIARLRRLEQRVAVEALARYERDRAKGLVSPDLEPSPSDEKRYQAWEDKRDRLMRPFSPPAWFQARTRGSDGRWECWPIDKVVEWSRTSRGGKQYEIFAPTDADTGCMRWGLCETAGAQESDS